MAEAMDPQGLLTENLLDAGCGQALTQQIKMLIDIGKKRESLELLAKHRRKLLDRCHAEQKKLDCLDYLIYQLEKDE